MFFKTAVVAAVLCPAFAAAQVTPQDVWDNMVAYTAFGSGTLSGTQTLSNGVLTVSDLTVTYQKDGVDNATLTFGSVILTAQPDGVVSLEYPEHQKIEFQEIGEDTDKEAFFGELTRSGISIIATGVPGDVTYETRADRFAFGNLTYTTNTPNPEVEQLELAFDSRDLRMTTRVNLLTPNSISTEAKHGELQLHLVAQRTGEEAQNMDVVALNATTDFYVNTPNKVLFGDSLTSMLENGMTTGIDFTAEQYALTARFDQPGDPSAVLTGSVENGHTSYAFAASGVNYKAGSENIALTMTFPEDPEFSIELSAASMGSEVRFPLIGKDTVQDAVFRYYLHDAELNDGLWDLADPTAILPRDPANLKLGVRIGLLMRGGLFDDAEEAGEDAINGSAFLSDVEVTQVDIEEASLSALGASFDGSAAFSIDMENMDMFFGFPAPTGVSNFTVNGAHGLLDKFVELGVMGNVDTLPARSFLSLLTTTTETPDKLTSTIEVDGDSGTVTANGIKIR